MIDGEIGFTLVSELTAVEPEFILSCNSTDGLLHLLFGPEILTQLAKEQLY